LIRVKPKSTQKGYKKGTRISVSFGYRFLYDIQMKTTLDIDDELLVKAKAASARERKSLTTLIEEGLRLRLRHARKARHPRKKELPVHQGIGGMVAGIDPLSNRSLLDAADDGT